MKKPRLIYLVRDVLDTQVLDRKKRAIGKVDGIGLELRDGAPPRVAYFESDAVTAWRRFGRRTGRWAARIASWWRGPGHPYRFPWLRVLDLDIDMEIDVDAERTPAFDFERWLREHVVRYLPGGRR
jgi:hypothetical protein